MFYFARSITIMYGFIQLTVLPGAYELESFNDEIKKINVGEGHFTKEKDTRTIKFIFQISKYYHTKFQKRTFT